MIFRPRPTLLKLFFIHRGSMLKKIWPQILAVAAISAVIVSVHDARPAFLPFYNSSGPFTLLGIALSIFLSFRNNACDRACWRSYLESYYRPQPRWVRQPRQIGYVAPRNPAARQPPHQPFQPR